MADYNKNTLDSQLKLGVTQEQFLKDTKGHLDSLYTNVDNLEVNIINVMTAAQGKIKAVVYDTYDDMIEGLKAEPYSTFLKVGDVIYLRSLDTPDYWVSGISSTQVTTDITKAETFTVGWFILSELETQKPDLSKLDQIDDSLLGVTADQIGKVKDVKVNGQSVLDGDTGIASITIEALKSEYVSIKTTDSCWTTKMLDGTTYSAIRCAKTDAAIEVYNSSNEKIITQCITDSTYLYICVGTESIECTLRSIGGNMSGGSSKYLHNIRISGTAQPEGSLPDNQVSLGLSVLADSPAPFNIRTLINFFHGKECQSVGTAYPAIGFGITTPSSKELFIVMGVYVKDANQNRPLDGLFLVRKYTNYNMGATPEDDSSTEMFFSEGCSVTDIVE